MLTFEEADRIVTLNLDCLNPEVYKVTREERGAQNLLFTVYLRGEFLGQYRVIGNSNGEAGCGSIQFNDKYSKEWDLIWRDMLFVSLKRAEEQMSAVGRIRPQEPPKPPKPKAAGGDLSDWLDWYHEMNKAGYKATLKDVAESSGWSYGYVKQCHMKYNAEHE